MPRNTSPREIARWTDSGRQLRAVMQPDTRVFIERMTTDALGEPAWVEECIEPALVSGIAYLAGGSAALAEFSEELSLRAQERFVAGDDACARCLRRLARELVERSALTNKLPDREEPKT